MNLDELRPILVRYRQQVQPAWSAATAHEGYDSKQGDPAGQCGVTSAWLQRRLLEDHGIESTYCVGSVVCGFHDEWADDHCWLEVGEGEDRALIDMTADQVACLPQVLAWTWWRLRDEDVRYLASHRLTAEQLAADPVQARLGLLMEALS